MQKFTIYLKNYRNCFLMLVALLFCSFSFPEDSRVFIANFLNKFYNKDGQLGTLKRFEIKVTNTGFCRYRRVLLSGKEEFFSFNLTRFNAIDFYGDERSGELIFRTKADDVIVQTRNDREGAVDSMATYMAVPLKNIDLEQLNELNNRLRKLVASELTVNK